MMSDEVLSIFSRPPPELKDLRTALREASYLPLNYWDALILGAAEQTYVRGVQEHYDRMHNSGGEACDCK